MRPYYGETDPAIKLYQGDALDVLAQMPAESVHMVVTSPPYWGLRKYAGDSERVWGDSNCAHDGSATCSLCGAWRGSYGLEPLHDCLGWATGSRCNACYVCHTLTFLDAIHRVLRKDGVVFWNLGDSYAANRGYQVPDSKHIDVGNGAGASVPPGLKPKDLVLIPQRVTLAAQSSGWWVRQQIIWAKPNPMPESVTDRMTNSYEVILMFTKAAKYFWDAEAVRQVATEPPHKAGANSHANVDRDVQHGTRKQDAIGKRQYAGFNDRYDFENPNPTRNLRDVWEIATQPYPDAHFATFPEAIPERCINAATSEKGVCAECGKPWAREVDVGYENPGNRTTNGPRSLERRHETAGYPVRLERRSETTGWQPTCSHDTEPVPATVLDPFAGAGTTLAVAKRMGRHSIGIEQSEEYCGLIVKRVEKVTMRLL